MLRWFAMPDCGMVARVYDMFGTSCQRLLIEPGTESSPDPDPDTSPLPLSPSPETVIY